MPRICAETHINANSRYYFYAIDKYRILWGRRGSVGTPALPTVPLVTRPLIHDVFQCLALPIAMEVCDERPHAQIQPVRILGAIGTMRGNQDVIHIPERRAF